MQRLLHAAAATAALIGVAVLLFTLTALLPARWEESPLVGAVAGGLLALAGMAWFRFLWGMFLAPDRKTGSRT
ncbi:MULTISPECIES: hypothetical protein [Streptomyces]|uniref:Uncharacterized protein n=1 Tax=Streptomyces cyaneofuscatus TaxID=66883 RepID=A0ABZ1F041_9ACTN|nr:hypothetical protein [Streptomyces cyaneofuscatus]WSB09723.1 hypothetical protein OG849_22055 [Streptomyces cyaneofuscatus]WSD46743.1 hypothetical protein OG857_13350 [Streptomyces cyaneofuscatus]WTA90117.1 hypothetical protein OG323_14365 [Streptomyces cyaneofuscatus]